MRKKKAFTLIELLVVIAIIALMLSILMPALTKVKIATRRVVCRTNLHQWSLAIGAYAAANDDKNISAFGYGWDGANYDAVVPNEFWLDAENYTGNPYYDHPGQFSYELMKPYMPSGLNPKGYTTLDIQGMSYDDPQFRDMLLKGAWTCPSFKVPELEVLFDNHWRITQRGFMRLRYSYYGRSDLWPLGTATHPGDFGGKYPGSKHLLMTDSLYWWVSGTEGLDYNHTIAGGKKTQEEMMVSGVEPGVAGINKMYGDGSVYWKDRREFQGPDADPTLFDISDGINPQVKSLGAAFNWY